MLGTQPWSLHMLRKHFPAELCPKLFTVGISAWEREKERERKWGKERGVVISGRIWYSGQKTTFRGQFFPFTVGLEDWTQVGKPVWQVPSPPESSQQASNRILFSFFLVFLLLLFCLWLRGDGVMEVESDKIIHGVFFNCSPTFCCFETKFNFSLNLELIVLDNLSG